MERNFEKKVDKIENQKTFDLESINDEFRLTNQNIDIIIEEEKRPTFKLCFNDIELEINKMGNKYFRSDFELSYYPLLNKISPIIETVTVHFQHEKGYNKDQKLLKMGKMRLNIDPLQINHINLFMHNLLVHSHQKYSILN